MGLYALECVKVHHLSPPQLSPIAGADFNGDGMMDIALYLMEFLT
jgi:hypothetical protein